MECHEGVQELKEAFEQNSLIYEVFQCAEYHNTTKLRGLICSGGRAESRWHIESQEMISGRVW